MTRWIRQYPKRPLISGLPTTLEVMAISPFPVTYNDLGVGYTKTERNNVETAHGIVITFPCPIKLYDPSMAQEVSKTPPPFKGFWLHTTMAKKEIFSNGWNPQRIKNSIYGAAIYLSRKKWDLDDPCLNNLDHTCPIDLDTIKSGLIDPKMFVCVLALQGNEVQSCFPSKEAPNGYTGDHLIDYLNLNVPEDKSGPRGIRRVNDSDNSSKNLRFSRNAGPGNNRQNKKISDYFLKKGTKAIKFLEHDTEVVAVFDASCIRVLSETTNFDLHPFPEILAGS